MQRALSKYRRRLAAGAAGSGSAGYGPSWLWYDSFATAAGAPLPASAAADPGPGTTHYAGSTGSKSGGNYVEDAGATRVGPYQNTGVSRSLLPACVALGFNPSRITSNIHAGFSASAGFGTASLRPGLQAGTNLIQLDGSTAQTCYATSPITTGTAWDFLVLADAIGGFSLFRASGTLPWTIAGLTRFDTSDPVFARAGGFDYAATIAATGLALGVRRPAKHAIFASSGVQGVVTLPSADFILGMRLTGTGTNGVRFRRVDGNNHFRAERTSGGALRLVRVDAGVDTVVSTTSMTAAANDRIYVRLEGNTCRISGHPTGGTWVNPTGATITQHTSGLGVEVLDEAAYDSLEVYPLTHYITLPSAP